MVDIPMDQVTEEFGLCWQAAARHLLARGKEHGVSWLRTNLVPPVLEHLSFRLGNQIFMIRVEDVDGELVVPANRRGLQTVAEEWGAHACLMPMHYGLLGVNSQGVPRNVDSFETGTKDWKPVFPGWGLVDVSTGEPIDPPSMVTDEKIVMTDRELHDFGVQVVRNYLEGQGRKLMSWSGDPHINPSLWFVGDAGPEWVVVRAVRYPETDGVIPADLEELRAHPRMQHPGHFASVSFASAHERFDNGEPTPLWRGEATIPRFTGLETL
jgi:hypothetical protein